jgi:Fe2+ or Zn2+ uptake regulation protein
MSADDDVSALVRLLTRYLRDNPLACDTAEGIARWWLASAAPINTVTLMRALDRMQASGAIEMLRAADGRVRYRRRQTDPPDETPPDASARDGERQRPRRTSH